MQRSVFSIEKVKDELIGGDDELAESAKARGEAFFLPPDSADLPSLADVSIWARSGSYEAAAVNQLMQVAGYYLVAQARARGFDVVTHEVFSDSVKKDQDPECLHRDERQVPEPLRDAPQREGPIRPGVGVSALAQGIGQPPIIGPPGLHPNSWTTNTRG